MHLSSYLLFDGNCQQAMQQYHAVLGGELTITLVSDTPMSAMFPPSMQHKVLNAQLKSSTVAVSASDWLRPSEPFVQGNNVALYISGGSYQQTLHIYEQLLDGATVTDPLTEQPFGFYGALQDRFGLCWKFHSVTPT